MEIDLGLAREAKALVALALRNGPIEDLHAGKACPTCSLNKETSRISDPEMKQLMKHAVDRVYSTRIRRKKPCSHDIRLSGSALRHHLLVGRKATPGVAFRATAKFERKPLSERQMKHAHVHFSQDSGSMLLMRERAPDKYEALLKWADFFTGSWDEPRLKKNF